MSAQSVESCLLWAALRVEATVELLPAPRPVDRRIRESLAMRDLSFIGRSFDRICFVVEDLNDAGGVGRGSCRWGYFDTGRPWVATRRSTSSTRSYCPSRSG